MGAEGLGRSTESGMGHLFAELIRSSKTFRGSSNPTFQNKEFMFACESQHFKTAFQCSSCTSGIRAILKNCEIAGF